MSSSISARRLATMAVVGGGAYAGAAYWTYRYLTAGQLDQEETIQQLQTKGKGSFVEDDRYRMERFQHISQVYDSQIERDEFYMGINLLRRMLLTWHASGNVLEVGAGTGRNLKYYPSSVERVVVTDSSIGMLDQARRKIKEQYPEVASKRRFACLEADASNLSQFPSDCFDTVVDTFGLCSYTDPVIVLKEMARVCKPSGKILLLEHGRTHSWKSLSDYLDKHAERHAKNWGCVWNRDLDRVLEDSGLTIERKDIWHFGTTYYVVCRPAKGEIHRPAREVLATSFWVDLGRDDIAYSRRERQLGENGCMCRHATCGRQPDRCGLRR